MNSHTFGSQDSPSPDAFAAPIAEDSDLIGFDGSQLVGRAEIVSTLQQIFADHPTAPYVSKVKSVRSLLKNTMAELYVEEKYGETRSYETNSQ